MNREIEARFLEVNKKELVEKLISLGALDGGEKMLSEIIFSDTEKSWVDAGKRVRLRSINGKTELAYKQTDQQGINGAIEIEFDVSNAEKAELFLERIGLKAIRHQEKRRHTLTLDDTTIDIDTWPKVPTYVEIEGASEDDIRKVAEKAGFDWSNVIFDDAREIIQKHYGIPYDSLRWFTFDRCE